jgi:hypothetical protein
MSTIKANNISPIGSTLTLGGSLAGLTVAGGLSLGGVGYFSGGVTFAGTTNHTGTARFAGNIIGSGNLTLSSSPFAWDGFWPQCVQTHVTATTSYTFTSTVGGNQGARVSSPGTYGANIAVLNTNITPKRSTSKVLVSFSFCGRASGPDGFGENNVFYITRTIGAVVTDIGSATAVGTEQPYGIKTVVYDINSATTMSNYHIMFLDSPATTSLVTYKLHFYHASDASAVSSTFYLNRTSGNANNLNSELGSSQCILQEYFA